MEDKRYPYTYAADYIRSIAGYNEQCSTKLSRSDASQIRQKISEILEIDDDLVARKIADYYLKNRDEIDNKSVDTVVKMLQDRDKLWE